MAPEVATLVAMSSVHHWVMALLSVAACSGGDAKGPPVPPEVPSAAATSRADQPPPASEVAHANNPTVGKPLPPWDPSGVPVIRDLSALPPGATARIGDSRIASTDPLTRVVAGPDRLFYAAAFYGSVVSFDAATGLPKRTLRARDGRSIGSIAAGGGHLLVAFIDGELHNLSSTGVVQSRAPALYGRSSAHRAHLSSVSIAADGSIAIAVDPFEGGGFRWRALDPTRTGRLVLNAFDLEYVQAAITPDGAEVAIAYRDGDSRLALLDNRGADERWVVDAEASSLAFSGEGKLAVGSHEAMEVRSRKDGRVISTYPIGNAECARFYRGGRALAIVDHLGVHRIDLATQTELPLLPVRAFGHRSQGCAAVTGSPEIIAVPDGTAQLQRIVLETGEWLPKPVPWLAPAQELAVTNSGDIAVVAQNNSSASLVVFGNGAAKPTQVWPLLHNYNRGLLKWSGDDLIVGRGPGVWRADPKRGGLAPVANEGLFYAGTLGPSDAMVTVVDEDSRVTVLSETSEVARATVHSGRSLAWSPRGDALGVAADRLTVLPWNGDTFGDPRAVDLGTHGQVAATTTGWVTAAWGDSGGIVVRAHRDNGDVLRTARVDQVNARVFTVSSRGHLVVASDADVFVYDRGGKRIHHFEGHQGTVIALAVSPDGTRIVSAGEDGWVFEWAL